MCFAGSSHARTILESLQEYLQWNGLSGVFSFDLETWKVAEYTVHVLRNPRMVQRQHTERFEVGGMSTPSSRRCPRMDCHEFYDALVPVKQDLQRLDKAA